MGRLGACIVAMTCALAGTAQAAEPAPVAQFVQGRDRYETPLGDVDLGDAALSGGWVVWTRRMLDGSWRVEMGAPGQGTFDLAKSPRLMPGVHTLGPFGPVAPGLAASPQRIVWTDHLEYLAFHFPAVLQDRLLMAEPRPGTTVQVAGCSTFRACRCGPERTLECYNGSRHFAAVDGDVVAYAEGEEGNVITIRRPGSPDVLVPTYGSSPFGVVAFRLAGRFLTWKKPEHGEPAIVYDWQAGRSIYRVPDDESVVGMQDDGKLVTEVDAHFRWRALPDETPHDIAGVAPSIAASQVAGDAIAFETVDTPAGYPHAALWFADLDGHAHVVADGAWAPATRSGPRPTGFGFDGHRLAWIAEPCGVATVMLAEDAATATSPPQPHCVQPRIDNTARTTSGTTTIRRARHGTLAVRLACPSGCRGRLEVTFVDDVPLTTLAARTVDLPPSARATTVRLRPSKRGARLVDRKRGIAQIGPFEVPGVNVSIALLGRDRDGEPVGVSALGNLCRSKRPCHVPFDVDYP
jgi:hypothetical protein